MWDDEGNDIDTSFLGFPAEEDFILYAPYTDKTLMNNVLAMDLGNKMGHYSSRTRYVELVVNDNYRGVYVLMEKIKRDNKRVDIAKLNEDDIAGDQLTGGYIFRIDKGIYRGWNSNYNLQGSGNKLFFQYYYPDGDNIQPQQEAYIQAYVNDFENAVASPSFINNKGYHYTHYIDLRSFVDQFIINELSKDVDAYRLSSYFHKDKDSNGGKLKAGPFWDFNLAFGNGDYCDGFGVEDFMIDICGPGSSPFWWKRFLQDEIFLNAMRCRWDALRADFLSDNDINDFINYQKDLLQESQARNFLRWPILGTYVWPNPIPFAEAQTHSVVVSIMQEWLERRSRWLDLHLPGQAWDCDIYDDPDFVVNTEVSITDIANEQLLVYPNPASDFINIQATNSIDQLKIFNILGELVYQEQKGQISTQVDIQHLKTGPYLVEIRIEAGIIRERMVITK